MSKYDFIIDGIRFSYSSASNFYNCPYAWKLTYLDREPRANNFYGEYGLLCHDCFEQFFLGKVPAEGLAKYYRDNYLNWVKTSPPPYPKGMAEKYYKQGHEFFHDFDFDMSNYEILLVEDTVDFTLESGVTFTARPDLVLKEKDTGKVVLFDYKTSTPFKVDKRSGKEKTDVKKMEGYYKQMHIYAHALRQERDLPIEAISLWFPRYPGGRIVTIPWEQEKEDEVLQWLNDTIHAVKQEETFPYNNKNKYFCNQLCGVREACPYRIQ